MILFSLFDVIFLKYPQPRKRRINGNTASKTPVFSTRYERDPLLVVTNTLIGRGRVWRITYIFIQAVMKTILSSFVIAVP